MGGRTLKIRKWEKCARKYIRRKHFRNIMKIEKNMS
jgi:hypothetical protein